MGVALITWARFFDKNGNKITVPAPSTTPGAPWHWDWLAKVAPDLRSAGFTALQLPPCSKAQGGAGDGCDGYGVFDPRDIGSKNQQGSLPTRYGNAESLRRLVAVAHAVGMDVYLDVVLHQLDGDNAGAGVFRYLGSDGKKLNGRGSMNPGCFRGGTQGDDSIPPFRPADPVPDPSNDFAFGREKVYQNSDPAGYTINDALDFGDWLFTTTGVDGMRCDDTKGLNAQFASHFMQSGAMAKKFVYSEYFDGNPATLNWWATSSPMNSRSAVEDFSLHWAFRDACNGGNARPLETAGYFRWNSFLACTFVDNPDTDTTGGQQVISNKGLAYAFMLTAPGYPFVYAKDYFPSTLWPGAYGLKALIDNLVWIHENLAFGEMTTRYVDDKLIVINRLGYPGLLTALNFDTWNRRTITCATAFGPDVQLHDYTGRHPDIWTDGGSKATFTVPSNAFNSGQSYLCFSRVGYSQPFALMPRETTQTFHGSDDLDVPDASPGKTLPVARIYCAANSTITLRFEAHTPGSYSVEILDPKNKPLPNGLEGATAPLTGSVKASAAGWYMLEVKSAQTNHGPSPFDLTATYFAPVGSENP